MTQEIKLEQFDDYIKSVDWLTDADSPVAITLEEILEPTEGREAVIFPPTFAEEKGKRPSEFHPYQIDVVDEKLTPQEAAKQGAEANICLIDSVGSQANRMENKFAVEEKLITLVPKIEIQLKVKGDEGERLVKKNLLEVGHRIADGVVNCTSLRKDKVENAIREARDYSNFGPLAQLAPTSLVFGFWDSRSTQYKFGRILSSTIRATNVGRIKRSAQYTSAFKKSDLPEELTANTKLKLSEIGLDGVPSTGTHGGVRVYGSIVRRTHINLVRLRALAITKGNEGELRTIDEKETLKLRRYILGLALVAAQAQKGEYDLRIGCLLNRTEIKAELVFNNKRSNKDFDWRGSSTFAYAELAAKEFLQREDHLVEFNAKLAKEFSKTAKSETDEK